MFYLWFKIEYYFDWKLILLYFSKTSQCSGKIENYFGKIETNTETDNVTDNCQIHKTR